MSYSLFSQFQSPEFKVGVVKPFDCLSRGWSLVKDQYLLFACLCLIIVALVSCIPFAGIIWGAWMCGIFLALLAKMRGALVSFNDIGKGFSYMGPGFVVGLLSGLPNVVVLIGGKLFEAWMDEMERAYPGDDGLPPEVLLQMFTYLAILVLIYVIGFLISGVIFAFAFQLVVDKDLSAWEATKLSARATRENFGGVMGLVLLELALLTVGVMLCCFGVVLVMPVTKASWAIAYSQVFLPTQPPTPAPQPPPPPVF
ncbi:MAG: hypothetical protein ND895_15535 [Pyrinomonadaceae bacterium]|nr:hypothetical protein [Pyrinomonadaceae bacterium]